MTTLTQCQQQVLDMLISYQKERGFRHASGTEQCTGGEKHG